MSRSTSYRSKASYLVVALGLGAIALGSRPSDACGPDFPENLLVRRADTLQRLWSGSFLDEVTRLVPAPPEVTPPPERGDVPTPIELATYKRGADAWHAKKLDEANRAFRELLKLPSDQRRHRSTWAAFMLGDQALLHQLIRDGYYDEKYLAAFQLGEDARHALHTDRIEDAVHLYAQQAAAGDSSGAVSLLFVVRAAVKQPASVDRLLRDDVGTHLLAAFYYARHDELDQLADKLWPRLRARASERGIALDLLAAAAYRDGHWDDAAAFARRAPAALLSKWVLAKLALRDGDTATAQRYLVEVEAARPIKSALDHSTDPDPLATARGELGLVALADQRFADALTWFRAGGQFVEASYVAERVLTVDEVRTRVRHIGDSYQSCWWRDDPSTETDCWDRNLPTVLARRLMRAGYYDQAIPYLDPLQQKPALDFALALREAAAADDPIDRAEKLLAAAAVARKKGMEILGTEHAPDWSMYSGDYQRARTCAPGEPSTLAADDDYSEGCLAPTPADQRFISTSESDRVASSQPTDPHRYHYRYLASQLAEQAANLLPPRSQAFAEALCLSAKYVATRDPQRVQTLWKRYVREGAVGFGGSFGWTCEAPDFAKARTFEADHRPPSRWRPARIGAAFLRRPWLWFVVFAGITGAALLVVRRRPPAADHVS